MRGTVGTTLPDSDISESIIVISFFFNSLRKVVPLLSQYCPVLNNSFMSIVNR